MTIVGNVLTREVFIDGFRLDPRVSQKVYNHSPDGFSWGYAGSGPAQLALAILLHYTDAKFAEEYYQRFKFDILCNLDQHRDLRLDPQKVKKWIKARGYES